MFSTLFIQVTLFALSVLCISSTNVYAEDNFGIKRFLHGCPFAFPCPPPPCDNPVFGPHDCCGSCPDPTTTASSTSDVQALDKKSDLSNSAEKSLRRRIFRQLMSGMTSHELRKRQFTTTTYPTTSECPQPCVHHGYHYCHPLPCHIECVDGVKQPGDCCYSCPNGKRFCIFFIRDMESPWSITSRAPINMAGKTGKLTSIFVHFILITFFWHHNIP